MRILKYILLITCFSIISLTAVAQNFGVDFENLKAENLTDEQILTLYERAQSEGISIQELEAIATARGMDPAEVAKLKNRLSELRSGSQQAQAARSLESNENRLRESEDNSETETVDPASVASEERPIFGSELFTTENLTFEPSQNIPTPQNYILGPGDQIIVDIWGEQENSYQLTISPEGSVQISGIGPIILSGLTIEKVSELLKSRLSEIYSGLKDASQNTFLQVSLGQVRTIKVNIFGEVRKPGTYSISSLSTVFNALYASGGPSKIGTYRNIQVLRNGEIIENVDLYDFLVYADQSSNIRLRDQDIIRVGTYENRISLNGETKITGLFETLEGETFEEVLEFAGGFNQQAYKKRIKIRRNTDTERSIVEIAYPEDSNTVLKSGDEVIVGKILDRYTNRVEIQGAVFREGEYDLQKNPTLYTLIQNADGLLGDAYKERAVLFRTLPDYTVKSIAVNLNDLMQNPDEHDIELKKDDVIQISSIFDLREDYTVNITGEVQNGGTFSYRKDMTIKDLIFMAEGFTSKAADYKIDVARRIDDDRSGKIRNNIAEIFNLELTDQLALTNPDTEFVLKPYDEVFVRKSPSYVEQKSVTIQGQVHFPGTYVIESRDFTISDLVKKAGGLTEFAYPRGASLSRNFGNLEESPDFGTPTLSQVGINLEDILRNPKGDDDLLLVPGDRLEIPVEMETVNIQGEVLFPINVQYEDTKSFRSYINSAGGFSENANTKKAYIVYANGEVDRTKKFLFFKSYPEVRPGSMIFIPQKEQKQDISPQERIAILSTIVSMAAIVTNTIFQIRRN